MEMAMKLPEMEKRKKSLAKEIFHIKNKNNKITINVQVIFFDELKKSFPSPCTKFQINRYNISSDSDAEGKNHRTGGVFLYDDKGDAL